MNHASSRTLAIHPPSRSRGSRSSLFSIAPFLLLLAILQPVSAAPRAELWERWSAHAPESVETIDHTPWDKLVSRYVQTGRQGVNRFAYGRIDAPARSVLDAYLATLSVTSISRYSRDQQLAFWINLYNALTVKVVLDHYPVKSIRDISISPGLFSSGPWGKKLIKIESEDLSLDDIEHRILRPIWRDPRIHYAVNCASIGCPDLQPMAFTAAKAGDMLEQAARDYINHPRGARVEGGRLVVSSIYKWFKDDFGSNDGNVIAHLRRYATPDLQTLLRSVDRIADYAYDWTLNDLPSS